MQLAAGLIRGIYVAAGGYTFHITPDKNAPGATGLQTATNEIATYALIACGIGLLGSLAALALAKGAHLERLHTRGKEGVIVALIGAFLVGGAAAFLNAAYSIG